MNKRYCKKITLEEVNRELEVYTDLEYSEENECDDYDYEWRWWQLCQEPLQFESNDDESDYYDIELALEYLDEGENFDEFEKFNDEKLKLKFKTLKRTIHNKIMSEVYGIKKSVKENKQNETKISRRILTKLEYYKKDRKYYDISVKNFHNTQKFKGVRE